MTAFLWVVWLVAAEGHVPGGTRMVAVFPPVEGADLHAALADCQEIARRLTRAEPDATRAHFCREGTQ